MHIKGGAVRADRSRRFARRGVPLLLQRAASFGCAEPVRRLRPNPILLQGVRNGVRTDPRDRMRPAHANPRQCDGAEGRARPAIICAAALPMRDRRCWIRARRGA